MTEWKKTLLSVVLLSLALLIDGSLVLNMPHVLTLGIGKMVPHFTAIVLILLSFYYEEKYVRLLAFIFGFITDAYYVGFLGIYMVGYFIMLYLVKQAEYFLNNQWLVLILLGLLGIFIIENFAYFIYSMLSITKMGWGTFFKTRLGATLLFNGIFISAFVPLFDRLMAEKIRSTF